MILAVQLLLPPSAPPAEPVGLAPRRQRPVVVPPAPEYAALLAAPIFAPDRRPGVAGGPSSATSGGSLAGYAALGVAAGGGAASAVVSAPGGVIKTLRPGDEVEGWRLAGVDKTHVVFERNGVRHALVIGAPPEAAADAAGTAAGSPPAPQPGALAGPATSQ